MTYFVVFSNNQQFAVTRKYTQLFASIPTQVWMNAWSRRAKLLVYYDGYIKSLSYLVILFVHTWPKGLQGTVCRRVCKL